MKWHKKVYTTIKKFMKKNWGFIKMIMKPIIVFFIGLIVVKEFSKIGEVKYKKKWKEIPGTNTEVYVENNSGQKKILILPIDPISKKRISVDEIKLIGLPENYKEGDTLNVKIIKGSNINRRAIGNGS